MRLQSNLSFSVLDELNEHVFEVWMGDQIRKHVDVQVVHKRQGVDEKLKFVDEQIVQVHGAPEVQLRQFTSQCFLVSFTRLAGAISVSKEAEVCHDLKIVISLLDR